MHHVGAGPCLRFSAMARDAVYRAFAIPPWHEPPINSQNQAKREPCPDTGTALFKMLLAFIKFPDVFNDAFIRRQDAAFIDACGKVDGDNDGDDDNHHADPDGQV